MRRAATRPTCCARRCCSAGSMPMSGGARWRPPSCCCSPCMVRPDNVIFVGVFAVLLLAFRQWSLGRAGRRGRLVCRLFRDLALGRTSRLVAASLFLERRAADEHGRLRSGLFGCALRQGVRQRGGALDHLQHLGRRCRAGACRLVRDATAPASGSTVAPASCLRRWCWRCWRSSWSSRSTTAASISPI